MRVCRNLVLVGVSKSSIGTQMTQRAQICADLFNYKSIKTICVHPLNLRHLRAFPQFDTSTFPRFDTST